jgi:hypothetical protein
MQDYCRLALRATLAWPTHDSCTAGIAPPLPSALQRRPTRPPLLPSAASLFYWLPPPPRPLHWPPPPTESDSNPNLCSSQSRSRCFVLGALPSMRPYWYAPQSINLVVCRGWLGWVCSCDFCGYHGLRCPGMDIGRRWARTSTAWVAERSCDIWSRIPLPHCGSESITSTKLPRSWN